ASRTRPRASRGGPGDRRAPARQCPPRPRRHRTRRSFLPLTSTPLPRGASGVRSAKDRFQTGPVVVETGNDQAGHLGLVVPAADGNGRAEPRLPLELSYLFRGHRPSLEAQTPLGSLGQPGVVGGFDGAQVALSGNVQSNG